MEQRVIYVMTHDSIGLGEDGPTHQPIEQLSGLRSIPNLNVFRPADRMETIECWEHALKSSKTPSVLSLTRQNLDPIRKKISKTNRCSLGAYEVLRTNKKIHLTIRKYRVATQPPTFDLLRSGVGEAGANAAGRSTETKQLRSTIEMYT